jgi:transposase
MLWGERREKGIIVAANKPTGCPMLQPNDSSRSLAALDENSTLIAVIEMSQSSWLVAGIVPGVERQPAKKLEPDEAGLLRLLHRWRQEAEKAGHDIGRIAVAFEAGRDGFWLARWLRGHGIEAYVIHPNSVAVSREHRRAKTDRLDTALLKRAFLGWLRGEREHCSMAAIPTLEEEDAKRPSREREKLVDERTRIGNRIKGTLARLGIRGFKPALRTAVARLSALRTPEGAPLPPNTLAELRREMARLRLLAEQIREIETARLQRLEQQPSSGAHPMIRLLAQVRGLGIETADLLVQEVLSRNLRDRRAVARYGGLTGAPDESGARRREKGLARAGNARVRRSMLQLAWRFLMFQKDSALAQWYRARTADARGATRKTMIVALARKLLIALWRLVTTGEIAEGLVLRPAR